MSGNVHTLPIKDDCNLKLRRTKRIQCEIFSLDEGKFCWPSWEIGWIFFVRDVHSRKHQSITALRLHVAHSTQGLKRGVAQFSKFQP